MYFLSEQGLKNGLCKEELQFSSSPSMTEAFFSPSFLVNLFPISLSLTYTFCAAVQAFNLNLDAVLFPDVNVLSLQFCVIKFCRLFVVSMLVCAGFTCGKQYMRVQPCCTPGKQPCKRFS